MNAYLFSSLGRIGPCEIVTAGRSTIVFVSSGIALLAGLLLIYVRAARHPVVLLVATAILAGLTAIYPELALMAAQASAVGLALVLLAVFLRQLTAGSRPPVARRSLQRRGAGPADAAAQRTAGSGRRRKRFLHGDDHSDAPGSRDMNDLMSVTRRAVGWDKRASGVASRRQGCRAPAHYCAAPLVGRARQRPAIPHVPRSVVPPYGDSVPAGRATQCRFASSCF